MSGDDDDTEEEEEKKEEEKEEDSSSDDQDWWVQISNIPSTLIMRPTSYVSSGVQNFHHLRRVNMLD